MKLRLYVLPILLLFAASAWASEGFDEVLRMQREGVAENVLQAYVENSRIDYNLSSDEIILLNDYGVPATVVETMIRKSSPVAATQTVVVAPPQAVVDSAIIVPSAELTDTTYFYDAMAPYGTWENDSTYGQVWTPTVARSDPSWRPYVHNGSWQHTDSGWYWNSGYSWGWAPFHYGRWVYNDRWSWVPDNTWGPAWVSWREADDSFGWAPLPPRSRFDAQAGFSYRDQKHVGVDFEFGLTERDYAFVGARDFFSADLRFSLYQNDRVRSTYGRTRVVNNYIYNDNRVINNGISITVVQQRSGHDVRTLRIRDRDVRAGTVLNAREFHNDTEITVYRPQVREGARYTPQQVVHQREEQRTQRTQLVVARQNERSDTKTDNREVQQQKATERREEMQARVKAQAEAERKNREVTQQQRASAVQRREETVKAKHESVEDRRDEAQKRATDNKAEAAQKQQEAAKNREAVKDQQEARQDARQDEAQKRAAENRTEAAQKQQEAAKSREAAKQQQDAQQTARQDEAQKRAAENKAEAAQKQQEAAKSREAAKQQQDAQQNARQDEAQKRAAENKAEATQKQQEAAKGREAAKDQREQKQDDRKEDAQNRAAENKAEAAQKQQNAAANREAAKDQREQKQEERKEQRKKD